MHTDKHASGLNMGSRIATKNYLQRMPMMNPTVINNNPFVYFFQNKSQSNAILLCSFNIKAPERQIVAFPNNVDPDERLIISRLIWINTVCPLFFEF